MVLRKMFEMYCSDFINAAHRLYQLNVRLDDRYQGIVQLSKICFNGILVYLL